MISFKQFVQEALVTKTLENWHDILEKNEYLKIATELLSDIEKLGGEALIVGGAVRDLLLGKIPKDVDLATNCPVKTLEANFHTNDIGKSKDFGIVNISYKGYEFEVANFRTDAKTSNGRHPDSVNIVNSFEEDSKRRDITFNALGLTKDGVILDYQGGIEDLNNKIIKTVGNAKERFIEDGLRLVRILRFSAKMGFTIDPDTKAAVIELKHLTHNISSERIRDELYKAATSGNSLANFIEHLDDIGLLQDLLPELKALQGKKHFHLHHVEGAKVKNKITGQLKPFDIENPEHQDTTKHEIIQGDAYDHTIAAIRASKETDPVHNLAIMLHDVGKATTHKEEIEGKHSYHGHENELYLVDAIATRLKLPNKDKEAIKFAMEHHMKAHKIKELNKNKILALRQNPNWPVLKSTIYSDEASRGKPLFNEEEFEDKMNYIEQIYNKFGESAAFEKRMSELITGKMIMELIPGIKGTDIGRIKEIVRQWIVENDFDVTANQVKDKIISLK